MVSEFFVIDARGNTSCSKKDDCEPESFTNAKSAGKRARELAQAFPGETIVIAHATAYVTCEVQPPTVRMKRLR